MSEMPKELEEIRDKLADEHRFTYCNPFGPQSQFCKGFNACYQAMLKTYVPREKVEKLVEALKQISGAHPTYCVDDLVDAQMVAEEALKEFGSGNE